MPKSPTISPGAWPRGDDGRPMIEDATSGYLMIGAGSALLLLVAMFDRWLLMAVFVVLVILGNQLEFDLNFRFVGQTVSPLDLAFGIGGLAASLRILGGQVLDRGQWLWLALTALLAAMFVRGAATYGFEAAAGSYRYWFYLTTGTLFVFSYPWTLPRLLQLGRCWLILAAILIAVIMVMWIDPSLSPFGEELAFQKIRRAYENQRVVSAPTTFILAQAGLVGLAAWLQPGRATGARAIGLIALLMVVLLYHRSVWGATASGIVVLMILNRGIVHRLSAPALLGLVLLVGAILLGEGLGRDLIAEQIDSALTEVLDNDSTLSWRVQGWDVLLRRAIAGGPVVWLFGTGFGAGYERMFGFYATQVSPHNLYVELFLNAGLAGLGLWLWFHARILLILHRAAAPSDLASLQLRSAAAMIVMMMAYCLPYSLSLEQAIWLGAIGALAGRYAPVPAHPAPARIEAA